MRTRLVQLSVIGLAAAVAVAFADSSIVALALPELYFHFRTGIVGVSWLLTAYNLVVAVVALSVFRLAGRRPRTLVLTGLAVFLAASLACGFAWSLEALLAFRCTQGLGAGLLLAGSLPLFASLTGSARRGIAVWTAAGAIGVAIGPALGGFLTQLIDWRAIFFVQAPIAAIGLAATLAEHAPVYHAAGRRRESIAANAALLLFFGAAVGALFLAVLLVVTVWEYSPIAGAAVVSALPLAALAVRPLSRRLHDARAVAAGAILLAGGLLGLALLPASSAWYAVPALALCGAGFGLAVPTLSAASVTADLGHSGTLSIGARHLGLVLGLAAIAPLLASTVAPAGDRATVNATAAILDARLPLWKKVPIALDLRDEFDKVNDGQIPDLAKPFQNAGSASDAAVRDAQDSVLAAIRAPLTRSFRPGFALAALLALLAAGPALFLRRRLA